MNAKAMATQPSSAISQASAAIARTMAGIIAQRRELEVKASKLSANLLDLQFAVESGDDQAKQSARHIRSQIREANERIEELRQAQLSGSRRLESAYRDEASKRQLQAWNNALGLLAQAASEARLLEPELAAVAKRVANILSLLTTAHQCVNRFMSMDQSHACAPDMNEWAMSVFGSFLRISKLPDDFIRGLTPFGLDSIRLATAPTRTVEGCVDRLLARLPDSFKLVTKAASAAQQQGGNT